MPKPYLLRRPSGLYVRLLVPAHLRAAVGSRFIVRSLGGLRGDAARLAAARLGYTLGLAWSEGSPAVPDFRKFEIVGTPGAPDFRLTTDGTPGDSAAALEALKIMGSGLRLPDPKPSPTLGQAAGIFLAQFKAKKRASRTVLDTENSMRLLLDVVGPDVPVADIGNAHMDALLALLPQIPPNASKRKGYKGLTPTQAAARAVKRGDPGLSHRTQEKHLDRLRVFFGWLYDRRDIDRNPIRTAHVLTRKADEARSRRPFSDAELALIFSPEKRALCKVPAQWWGPLLALYTGARAQEIGQWWTDDLEEIGGVWGLHISARHPGQHVKNPTSQRFVPVHPALLDAGLLAWRDHVRTFLYLGDGPLLPNLNGRAINGDALGDWFNRTALRAWCGIEDKRVVFHCFRGTFASRAERAGLSDARIGRLTGHAGAEGSALRAHYIDPPSLPERAADMQRVTFPAVPDLTPYHAHQFRDFLGRALRNRQHLARRRKG